MRCLLDDLAALPPRPEDRDLKAEGVLKRKARVVEPLADVASRRQDEDDWLPVTLPARQLRPSLFVTSGWEIS